ncbi:MAG: hypothetical protein V1699_01800 [Candidatus Omnitrophota bacterium]
MASKCKYCHRYFVPDSRVGSRQKSCGRIGCKKKRREEAQRKWLEKNPGYFKGRYWYVKEWRRVRGSMIQDKIPPSKPLSRLILLIPAGKKEMIQDKIIFERVNTTTFVASGYG